MKDAQAPGTQYLAVDASGPVAESFGGWADRARGRPVDAATTMTAYSMSKTITAVAVLQLVESGRIALDDPVDASLYGGGITVRHLLAHTSGVPNPLPLRWVHPVARHASFDEKAALDAVLAAHPRARSRPGDRFAYSNIGYWLLGPLVARASGRPFTAYVAERVLEPLGIGPDTLGYAIADPERNARGYLKRWSAFNLVKGFLIDRELIGPANGSWVEILPHYVDGPAFGGLIGTARAFGKLLIDLLRPRSAILGERGRALLFEPQRRNDGRPVAMTLGWHIGETRGISYYFKEGGGGGFHSMMRIYPKEGVGSVVLGNGAGFDAGAHLDAADARLVE